MQAVSLDDAFGELRAIRAAIERAEQNRTPQSKLITQRRILVAALVAAVLLQLVEILRSPSLTSSLYFTHYVEFYRYLAIGMIFAILVVSVGLLYLLLWRTARKDGEALAGYLSRNFSYLQGFGFLSDLFVKFVLVSILFLAERPDWISALLVIFTGDYLIQGRFFCLPLRMSLVWGWLYLLLGAVILLYLDGLLSYALAAFLAPSIVSVLYCSRRLSTASGSEPNQEQD